MILSDYRRNTVNIREVLNHPVHTRWKEMCWLVASVGNLAFALYYLCKNSRSCLIREMEGRNIISNIFLYLIIWSDTLIKSDVAQIGLIELEGVEWKVMLELCQQFCSIGKTNKTHFLHWVCRKQRSLGFSPNSFPVWKAVLWSPTAHKFLFDEVVQQLMEVQPWIE